MLYIPQRIADDHVVTHGLTSSEFVRLGAHCSILPYVGAWQCQNAGMDCDLLCEAALCISWMLLYYVCDIAEGGVVQAKRVLQGVDALRYSLSRPSVLQYIASVVTFLFTAFGAKLAKLLVFSKIRKVRFLGHLC